MKSAVRSINRVVRVSLICAIAIFSVTGCFMSKASGDCGPVITLKVSEGDPDVVSGTVTGVDPEDVWVVVYVRTNQWYIQPYADNRAYLSVNADGSYETWISGWNQISAFVIRKNFDVFSNQQLYRPFPLNVDCEDVLAIAAYPTTDFSGYEWAVKGGVSLGPGQNNFSTGEENAWVDNQGCLHLQITQKEGQWYCPEVYLMEALGYGTYHFELASRVDILLRSGTLVE